ncbi:MAG: hypothetical protein JWR85_2463 [Marmoricola sp.]|nr:hypothetical protein [Marmoricola sp.]
MSGWRVTGALVRATATAVLLTLAALAFGRPDLLVLAAPFGLVAALGFVHAPRGPVTTGVSLADRWLYEGQSTRLLIRPDNTRDLEQATVTLTPSDFVVPQPASGVVALTPGAGTDLQLELSVSPRRWGVRSAGRGMFAATSHWGGYRWGPERLVERTMIALPQTLAFTADESPHPVGLVGQSRSRRPGGGSEFLAIRPFQPGDRVRRVNWRTTLRTGQLHAVGTSALEDSSLMILVDAVSDVGASGGVDGEASSLDVAVRAASALAAHHIRVGDRVALRVLGRTNQVLGPGAGLRHQRRLQEQLAGVQPGWPDLLGAHHVRLRAGAGTLIVALSSLLTPEFTSLLVTLAGRGLTVVVIDTLDASTLPEPARDPHSAARLAWRIRLVERDMQVTEVTRRGIPVVPWRGPGTLDEVLRRLARRSRVPREITR